MELGFVFYVRDFGGPTHPPNAGPLRAGNYEPRFRGMGERGHFSREDIMSFASDSRKYAQEWFDVAERFPPKQRHAALEIAEAWFQLAMDAASLETDNAEHLVPAKASIH